VANKPERLVLLLGVQVVMILTVPLAGGLCKVRLVAVSV
jgi:hypothetical protein